MFFWNWFGINDMASDYTAVSATARNIVWILVDSTLPALHFLLADAIMRNRGLS